MENVLYCFKFLRLTLGIGNFMSSHSLSAGHVPLGLGRDIYIDSQANYYYNLASNLNIQAIKYPYNIYIYIFHAFEYAINHSWHVNTLNASK